MQRRATTQFGVVLSRLLATRGLTQSDLARSLGVAPATVARWMGSSRTPTAESVTKIARQLDLAEDDPDRTLLFHAVGFDPDVLRAEAILMDPRADPDVQRCLRLLIRIGASYAGGGVPAEVVSAFVRASPTP
jgi:transcriptional regulator with XRE-family HTH domain